MDKTSAIEAQTAEILESKTAANHLTEKINNDKALYEARIRYAN